MTRPGLTALGVCFALTMGACALGVVPEVGEKEFSLTSVGWTPLAAVSRDQWEDAPPSCEGLLRGDETFAVAQASGGLVGAVGETGIVCVDTVAAVEEELASIGEVDAAHALVHRYAAYTRAAVAVAPAEGTDPAASDPDPQPSKPSCPRPIEADPDPQPSLPDSAASDPDPQPSRPAGAPVFTAAEPTASSAPVRTNHSSANGSSSQ